MIALKPSSNDMYNSVTFLGWSFLKPDTTEPLEKLLDMVGPRKIMSNRESSSVLFGIWQMIWKDNVMLEHFWLIFLQFSILNLTSHLKMKVVFISVTSTKGKSFTLIGAWIVKKSCPETFARSLFRREAAKFWKIVKYKT